MAKYAIGDIHGAYLALTQVLQRCNFNKNEDTLFVLGDVCDGWTQTVEVINELLTLDFIFIYGNHDQWLENWLRFRDKPEHWIEQGGNNTIQSYQGVGVRLMLDHLDKFFAQNYSYYIDDNRVFVHGGFNRPLREMLVKELIWDRTLWKRAMSAKDHQLNLTKDFDKVFIGHTALDGFIPLKKGGNVWNLDTDAGADGKLTIMNIDTEEYWQSDFVKDLYPKEHQKRIEEYEWKKRMKRFLTHM